MPVNIDVKEKLSYEDFVKQFGDLFQYSTPDMKEKKMKQAYAKAIKKFPAEEKVDVPLDKAVDIQLEANKEYPARERRKKDQD